MTESYHRGEIAVQELAGERSQAVLNGRVLSRTIPAAARPFVGQQSSVVIGWLDASGAPWASLVVGEPGFASCDEGGTVVTLEATDSALPLGPPQDDIRAGDPLGMLVIDLATRRRLRVNGLVERSMPGELRVAVEQAFPNCPKYIQRRERVEAATTAPTAATSASVGLPADLPAWLSRTDTAFVVSVGPDARLDCSHRGGRRGFMQMDGDAVLVPDYPGNSMFCSLGNMAVDPRAGLVLVDFDARQQLHLSGEVTIDMARPDPAGRTAGTGRWWRLTPRTWAVSALAGTAHWRLVDESPFNPRVEP
ncbi:MAG: pyridoxamine 5'-phosphate oxidase family protein [Vicinamibacterales bacterium]